MWYEIVSSNDMLKKKNYNPFLDFFSNIHIFIEIYFCIDQKYNGLNWASIMDRDVWINERPVGSTPVILY